MEADHLDAIRAALAEKDSRIAELERELASRPVADWPEAKDLRYALLGSSFSDVGSGVEIVDGDQVELVTRLRDFVRSTPPTPLAAREIVVESTQAKALRERWAKESRFDRSAIYTGDLLHNALRAFCESAPPASLPVREIVVESEAARKLRERLRSPFALPFVSPTDWATLDYKRTAEILREFRDSAPPTIAPSESERVRLLTEQLNAQAKSHAEEGERWSREMGELKCELEALKAAPAQDEYTKAADAVVVARRDPSVSTAEYMRRIADFEALYDARQRGDASAAKVEPAFKFSPPPVDALTLRADGPAAPPIAVCGGTNFNAPAKERRHNPPPPEALVGALQDRPCETSGRLLNASPVLPAPAEERVTLYVYDFKNTGGVQLYLYRRADNDSCLGSITLDAMRDGGGEKGGAS